MTRKFPKPGTLFRVKEEDYFIDLSNRKGLNIQKDAVLMFLSHKKNSYISTRGRTLRAYNFLHEGRLVEWSRYCLPKNEKVFFLEQFEEIEIDNV